MENKKNSGRPRFNLQQQHVYAAYEYLKKHYSEGGGWRYAKPEITAEALQNWCDNYLTPKEFSALRAALRKKMQRERDEVLNTQMSTLNFRPQAMRIFRNLAEQDGIDYNTIVIEYLGRLAELSKPQRRQLLQLPHDSHSHSQP